MAAPKEQWICTLCTFDNEPSNNQCEMCDTPKPNIIFDEENKESNMSSNTDNTQQHQEMPVKQYLIWNNTTPGNDDNNHNENKHNNDGNSDISLSDDPVNNDNTKISLKHSDTAPIKAIIPKSSMQNNNYINKLKRKPTPRRTDQWECSICTCYNNAELPYCEACNTPKKKKQSMFHAFKQMQKKRNKNLINKDVETMKRQKQIQEDLKQAQLLEQKYQHDAEQFDNDRAMALKVQKEYAKGVAWFCGSCFTMNIDIKSYRCNACNGQRPRPKISAVMTVTDAVSMKIVDILRDGLSNKYNIDCIVNLALAQNFVNKYLSMCRQRGLQLAQPQICYHWTRQQFFDPIKKQGLKVPDGDKLKHATDPGFYGRGIYMSPDPKYAQSYGRGAKQFFVGLSVNGKQFPSQYPRDRGIGLKHGYDSHYSADCLNEITGIPNEWVFFEPSQLLLCYHITLEQVQYITPVLNQVINYLVSKYNALNNNDIEEIENEEVRSDENMDIMDDMGYNDDMEVMIDDFEYKQIEEDKEDEDVHEDEDQVLMINNGTYQCPKCGQVMLLQNWIKCDDDNYYQCPVPFCEFKGCGKCGIEYDIHNTLNCKLAKKIHDYPKNWTLCGCGEVIRNGSIFSNIYKAIYQHEKCKRYCCFVCGDIFVNILKAMDHRWIHENDETRVCYKIEIVHNNNNDDEQKNDDDEQKNNDDDDDDDLMLDNNTDKMTHLNGLKQRMKELTGNDIDNAIIEQVYNEQNGNYLTALQLLCQRFLNL